jgi:hypothetical protein
MTAAQIQAAFAALDGLMTGASFIADKIREGTAGLVLPAEQQARLDAVDDIRAAVGLPKPQG